MAERDEEWMIELAAAKVDHGADRIERIYSWEVERLLAVVRAALAVAGSIIAVAGAAVSRKSEGWAPGRSSSPWQLSASRSA
jgi:hypothetical protein